MLNNIALIHRKSGRPKAAEPYYLHALELYERQLGTEHTDVASVLNNLAVFYTNERRFNEAEENTPESARNSRKKACGPPEAPGYRAIGVTNLAVVYHARGDYARASELYRASLLIWEASADQPAGDYEIGASNYADLLRSLGKMRRARRSWRERVRSNRAR